MDRGPGRAPAPRADRATWAVLGGLLALLALASALRVHGSSVALWTPKSAGTTSLPGVVLGTPRNIRVDEWGVITPAILSQARQAPPFPQSDRSWGGAKAPLLMNVPVRQWGAMLRPQHWGFLVFDLERAFAFYWNMKLILLFGGVFLLLRLLTANDAGVSLVGAAWVVFSGFTQWWCSTPAMLPEMIGYGCLAVVAAAALARASTVASVAWTAAALALALVNFALCLYPPFQVAVGYLLVALAAGVLAQGARGPREPALARRLLAAAAALLFAFVVVGSFAADAKETVDLVRGTVYPGDRTSAGGDVPWTRVFGGIFGFFLAEHRYPPGWDNVCEASGFLLLFPLPLVHLVSRVRSRKQVRPIEWCLLGYVVLVLSWMRLGWPGPLAGATGFRHVPGVRATLGLGLASILWCCVFLAREDDADAPTVRAKLVWASAAAMLALAFALYFRRSVPGFLEPRDVLLGCALSGAAAYTLVGKHTAAFAATVLAPGVLAFGLVNPLAVGLSTVLEDELCRKVQAIVRRDPGARWTVYGNDLYPNLIKTTGAHVFNGTLVVPPFADLAVLDPRGSARTVYNRYAHVGLTPVEGAPTRFEPSPESGDRYSIRIDPKSDEWRRLGIRYVVLPYPSADRGFLAVAELVETSTEDRLYVYRYRW
jgi:hypothetical protein